MKLSTVRVSTWKSVGIVFGIAFLAGIRAYRRSTTNFLDDSYMFYRYAMNFRHGLGWSWNPDGVHTYGMTSLVWQAVILLTSFLPGGAGFGLVFASVAMFCLAVLGLAWFLAKQSTTLWLQSVGNCVLLIGLPLELQFAFLQNMTNGMETMLAFLWSAAIACLALQLAAVPSLGLACASGVCAYLSFATRPESALCALLIPAMVLLFVGSVRHYRLALLHTGTMLGFAGLQLLWAKQYFGTAVPLSFYLKTRNAYAGFTGYSGATEPLSNFFAMSLPYFVLLILFAGRRKIAMVLALLIPTALTVLYLDTVVQIMGASGRYYVPYLPYVMVACWLVFDDAMMRSYHLSWKRLGIAAALVLLLSTPNEVVLQLRLQERYRAAHRGYPVPQLAPASPSAPALHMDEFDSLLHVSNDIGASLPTGTTIAASEVGFLGALAQRASVLDLAGLNSREITMSGFSPDVVFGRRPDVLWMPHTDYTGFRAAILRDARLFKQYDYLAGAYSYGIGIRKDSPVHDLVMHQIASTWATYYPGTRMQDYIVSSIQ